MAIFLISSLVPSSSFPLVIHETPPDVIQVYWENKNFEHVDYFELSILYVWGVGPKKCFSEKEQVLIRILNTFYLHYYN